MAIKKSKVKYSEEFENMILSIAIDLEAKGLTEGPLGLGKFKDITIYLNKTPSYCLYKCTISKEAPFLKGKTICAGADSISNSPI